MSYLLEDYCRYSLSKILPNVHLLFLQERFFLFNWESIKLVKWNISPFE